MAARRNWRLVCVTLFQAVFGWGTMCDLVILNPLVGWVKDLANQSVAHHYGIQMDQSHIDWLWASCSGMSMLGGIVASLTIKYPAEYFGRRKTVMIIKNLISLVALVLHLIARPLNSIELLLCGRFLSGMSCIYASMVTVYMSECSPVQCRGAVATATVAIGNGCQVIGTFAALLVDEHNWHYVFLVSLPFIVIHLAGAAVIPESIKHLYISCDNRKLSRSAAVFYHGTQVKMEVLETNMRAEAEVAPTNRRASLKSTLAAAQLRWPLVLCCVLSLSLSLSGYVASAYYSAGTLVQIGVPRASAALYSVFLIQFPGFVCSLVALVLVEKVGRRCLLLVGYVLLLIGSLCWLLSSPLSQLNDTVGVWCQVGGMGLSMTGGRIGPGMLCFTLPGELAPQTSRSLTFGIASALSWIGALAIAFLFPSFYAVAGSYSVIPFVLFMTFSLIFIAKYMPETKGKTVRKIVEPWMPVRKNACHTINVIDQETRF